MSENELNNQLDEALRAGKPKKKAVGKKKTAAKKSVDTEANPSKARPAFVMISGTVTDEAYYDGYRLHEGDRATVKCPTSDKFPKGRIPTWLEPDH